MSILVYNVISTRTLFILQYKHCLLFHSTAVCESRCMHGRCIGPNRCQCDAGWTGKTCSQGKFVIENLNRLTDLTYCDTPY